MVVAIIQGQITDWEVNVETRDNRPIIIYYKYCITILLYIFNIYYYCYPPCRPIARDYYCF